MNFKEICEAVLEESDGRAVQLPSVSLGRDGSGNLYVTNPTHRNVIRWVQQAYTKIQNESSMWEFHHKRGLFLTLEALKDEYAKSGVREIYPDSFYVIKDGTTARQPVYIQDYEWWLERERSSVTDQGAPLNLIEAPGDKWIIWPKPVTGYALYGQWWMDPDALEEPEDEPCWDERFHPILKWEALKAWAAEFASEGSMPKILARAKLLGDPLWRAFCREYMPPVGGASTFL